MKNILTFIIAALLTAASVSAQTYKPAIEYQSLMNMRYYEANGGFMVEDLQLVFPPANIGDAKFVITNKSGGVVDTMPLRYEAMEFPAFGRFRAESGNPGIVRVGQTGDFVMSVIIDGQTITSLPFSLREENSSDPFNPVKRFVRDGPWSDLAYFTVVPDDPNGEMTFNWWMSLREIPGAARGARVTLHLMANGKEIASRTDPVVPTVADWQFTQHRQISVPTLPRNHWLTLADVQKLNGEISVVVKANGQPVKTYKAMVSGGHLQHLSRSALNFEPHAQFVSPRFIDVSSGTNSQYKMYVMYWMKKQ